VTLDALARPSGTFVMVAMDQRESLRTMLRERGHDATDERVARFKLAVARELASHASGFLVDSDHVETVAPLVPRGLILAVDRLVQEPGGIVEATSLDDTVAVPPEVVALKLLVIWRDDELRTRRIEMSRRFSELARRHGVLSVLEGVVRGPDGFDREAAIVQAADELAATGCNLYKCEVPTHGRGAPDEITRWCREIDAAVACPWVVLSQGVEPDAYPRAVEAACRGGASGILAGRAVWTATLEADDPTELLRERSVPRLEELARIVDAHGRPWRESA